MGSTGGRTGGIPAIGLLLCLVAAAVVQPVAAADSLTRGSMFTVSIAAKPNTAYYVWFTGTSAMSGEPGDQPPVIVAYSERVEFDPDGGPYTIGSYQYYNGNGRTILDDVAPSSATVSSTRYYAKVTTDPDGVGIVQFRTSSATADRTFTIKAQNPASPADEVPVKLGLPAAKTTAATPAATAADTTAVPPSPSLQATTAAPLTTAPPPVTSLQEPPATTLALPAAATTRQQAPVSPAVIIIAAIAGLLLLLRTA